MRKSFIHKIKIAIAALLLPIVSIAPFRAMGEVAPIEETREQIENISQEQMAVLEELFVITKELEALEKEETKIKEEIKDISARIAELEDNIDITQKEYDSKRDRMKQVLVYYQRGGPATYLEILLNADGFSEFLKSLNAIKDISHNVSELLNSLDSSKAKLQEEKLQLDEQAVLLQDKEYELGEKRKEREAAKQKREAYLSGLEENRIYYEEQLKNLQLLWEDCMNVFQNTVSETSRIIGEGYFTSEDLNLGLGLFTMPGAIKEDTFNRVLNDNSEMTETYFHFKDGDVILEAPELHLVLHGNFVITDDSAIRYEVSSGTFYELSLDALSIQSLFEQGPLIIDFAAITGDIEIVDFILQEVKSEAGQLAFVIKLKW